MLLHVQHAVANGCKEVTICCTDTDVVVLAVATFQQLGLEKFWIGFWRNKDFMIYMYMYDISNDLGIRTVGLSFFHAFTGCDTVSAFRGKGKRSAWQTWEVFPDATDVFTRLRKRPHSLLETDIEIIEAFVCIIYDRGTDTFAVNKARLELFARKQRPYDALPPTLDALIQHTKRAVYQGVHV